MAKKIDRKTQLTIFYEVFSQLVRIPSVRWRLMVMIETAETIDEKELEIKLDELYIEILKREEKDT